MDIKLSGSDDLCFLAGGADVYHRGVHLRVLLAPLSRLLHIRLSQQYHCEKQLRSTYVPGLLLARNVKRNGESPHLLLDE